MKIPENKPPLPEGFIEEIRDIPGIDHEMLFAALDGNPSVGVRTNSRKDCGDLFAGAAPVPWCRSGFYLDQRPKFTLMPELHAGGFYVQDPSSMILRTITEMICGGKPSVVIDFCASPGGKTTAAIDALPDGSVVIANEFEPSRVGALKENITKWGYPGVAVTNAPTSAFRSLSERADIAIVDAPCSGEGMMRKDPDARKQWSPALVEQCARLQRDILADAAETVRPGGYLVYSTCTFNTAENEKMLDFIGDELGLESFDTGIAEAFGISSGFSARPALRFMPHITRGEGLFAGVFRKPGSSPLTVSERLTRPGKRNLAEGHHLLDRPEGYEFSTIGNKSFAVPGKLANLLSMLPKKTRISCSGVELGETKGKDFIPSPSLALSCALKRGVYPEVSLSREEALAFLRREVITLPSSTEKGFCLICYGGLPLGWAKNIGNRANNLFPQAWRIRC